MWFSQHWSHSYRRDVADARVDASYWCWKDKTRSQGDYGDSKKIDSGLLQKFSTFATTCLAGAAAAWRAGGGQTWKIGGSAATRYCSTYRVTNRRWFLSRFKIKLTCTLQQQRQQKFQTTAYATTTAGKKWWWWWKPDPTTIFFFDSRDGGE